MEMWFTQGQVFRWCVMFICFPCSVRDCGKGPGIGLWSIHPHLRLYNHLIVMLEGIKELFIHSVCWACPIDYWYSQYVSLSAWPCISERLSCLHVASFNCWAIWKKVYTYTDAQSEICIPIYLYTEGLGIFTGCLTSRDARLTETSPNIHKTKIEETKTKDINSIQLGTWICRHKQYKMKWNKINYK